MQFLNNLTGRFMTIAEIVLGTGLKATLLRKLAKLDRWQHIVERTGRRGRPPQRFLLADVLASLLRHAPAAIGA